MQKKSMALFLVTIVLSVAILIFMVLKLKFHPCMALVITSLFAGLMLGNGIPGTISMFTGGFGGTLGAIGCPIIFGSIMAMGIRDSDSTKSMVNAFVKLLKGKNLELAVSMAGFVMSIPVFGDVVGVLMAPIGSSLAKRTKVSTTTYAAWGGLASSLTHACVPPTPGILAVAIMLSADLGLTILWGTIACLIAFFVTWVLLHQWIGKDFVEPKEEYVEGIEEVDTTDYRNLLIKGDNIPSLLAAAAPILAPVLLITVMSFVDMYVPEGNAFRTVMDILGERNAAMFIGVIITMIVGFIYKDNVIANYKRNNNGEEKGILEIMTNDWMKDALQVALLPLMITAMGGGFSTIIKSYPGIEELGNVIAATGFPGFIIPFLVSAIVMVAVGSRTTAAMTAAAICLPMLSVLGISPLAATLLIGSGTMIGSHVSDSGFWVTCSFYNLNVKQGLKCVTVVGTVAGLVLFVAESILVLVGLV